MTYGDLEDLGGKADGALDAEILGLGALNELGADLLESLDLAGGEGDADTVDLLFGGSVFLLMSDRRYHDGDDNANANGQTHTGASPKSFWSLL